jgi:glycosyltransferase involved in cell wall biosynthesis
MRHEAAVDRVGGMNQPGTGPDSPLVSVVIPLYNGGRYIAATLKSVLSQTYDRIEILVVDDGSSDDGPEIVAALAAGSGGRIRLMSHPDGGNHGIAASRNLAIRNAGGPYIAFVDQDDVWVPEKLQKQVDLLQRFAEADLVYSRSGFIDQEGIDHSLRGIHRTFGKGVDGRPSNVFSRIIKEDFIPTLTVVVRKCCLERVGLLDEGPAYEFEDWLLMSKLAFYYKVIFIPTVLAKWRVHGANYSGAVLETGLHHRAEEHYTITLFSFLMSREAEPKEAVRRFLRRRLWFFFLRARSWGVSRSAIGDHAHNFLNAFPSERPTIRWAVRCAGLVPPRLGWAARRVRRYVFGM